MKFSREGPYRLSGFCGMALVAFEVARRLHQQGQEVSLLALIDPPSVQAASRRPLSGLRYDAYSTPYHLSRLAKLHPKSWLGYCLARGSTMRRRILAWHMGITDQFNEVDALSRMEKAGRAYRPKSYPGRVTLIVTNESAAESAGATDFGWSAVSDGGVEVRLVPGNHGTLFEEPNVWTLAKELRELLVQ